MPWGLQPWNVASNFIFLLLAITSWRSPPCRYSRYGFIVLALGSTIWHTFLTRWALWCDLIGIIAWITMYFCDVSRIKNISIFRGVAFSILYLITLNVCAYTLRPLLPKFSGAFIPQITLMLIAACIRKFSSTVRRLFILGALFMAIGIFMREQDLLLCNEFTMGTHWLWHICVGLSLAPFIYALKEIELKKK